MKKRTLLYPILFGILMLFLFLPMMEEHFKLFKFQRLSGVYHKAPKPELTFENYKNGQWQRQTETYISENFGFRIPVIRMYNQYVYDFYHKTFSGEITVGKDGWLYQKDGTVQYFGRMNQRHNLSNEEFEQNLAIETRSLVKIRAILKEYGVELMTFTLPVKSYIYPEHLRPQRFIDTTFHADEYYNEQLTKAGFPHINMTPWFQTLRHDYPFTLFYEKGSHWASGAVLATDSLFRFMETLKGDQLADIVMGTPYEVAEKDVNSKDRDLAELLNIVKIPKQHMPLWEIPVTIEADSNTVYPSALFIGTSYFWYMTPRVPFEKVFSRRDLIFYDAQYYTNEEQTILNLNQINYLREVLCHDYVIYFKNAPQLYNDGFQFFGKTLIGLCISDERFQEKRQEVADSLALYHPVDGWERKDYLNYADVKLIRNPELFEELRGTEVPTCRNPKLRQLLAEREIRNNKDWAFLMECKAKHDSLNLDKVFEIESGNLINGRPLIQNNVLFTPYDYIDHWVEMTLDSLRRRPESQGSRKELRPLALAIIDSLISNNAFENDTLMQRACIFSDIMQRMGTESALETLRKKARDKQVSLDKAFRDDVLWVYQNRENEASCTPERLKTLYENYLIEHGFWISQKSLKSIKEKALSNKKPFLVTIAHDVEWIKNNRQQTDNP